MEITYIGNFRPDYSTENHVARSLEMLGHTITRLQEDLTSFDEIDRAGGKFILYTRTWDNIKGDRDRWLRNKSLPLVGFSLDIWIGLDRERETQNQLFFKSDYLFTADGGHQEEFTDKGIKHFWLQPGVVADECYIDNVDFQYDIIFAGSYRYHSEYPERTRLIDYLETTYRDRFTLFDHNSGMRGARLNRLYASSRVVIGDSLDSPYYWSDRVPETLGRGGLLLHPQVEGMDKYYTAGSHYIPYIRYDHENLKKTIDSCLENPEMCQMIRQQGHGHVKANHTYTNRMAEMLKVLKLEGVI